jgi:hypothetical protein
MRAVASRATKDIKTLPCHSVWLTDRLNVGRFRVGVGVCDEEDRLIAIIWICSAGIQLINNIHEP